MFSVYDGRLSPINTTKSREKVTLRRTKNSRPHLRRQCGTHVLLVRQESILLVVVVATKVCAGRLSGRHVLVQVEFVVSSAAVVIPRALIVAGGIRKFS